MLAQLIEYLLRLERREDRLDESRRAHGAPGHAKRRLRADEDIVPEPGLEVALHLRQVEIGTRPAREELARIVEEIEAEIEQPARDGLPPRSTCFSGRCQPRGRTKSVAVLSASL